MSTTIPRPSDGPVRDASKFAADPPEEGGKKKAKKPGKDAKPADPASAKKKKIAIAVVLLVALGAAYLFVLKPKPAATTGPPEPGIVVQLDPLTLNLADGHYLKLSMALQFTAAASAGGGHGGAAEEPDGSQALDIAIAQLSNRKVAELNSAAARKKAKAALLEAVAKAYHDDVMDIYFTEFVMQ
ncbi:MAG: flagellar basal body-associated FliL family protein [Sporichthyaceae bacterium]